MGVVTLPRTDMTPRPLILLAAPIAFSLLLVLSLALALPAPLQWALLLTQIASWGAFAWWQLHQRSSRSPNKENSRLLREQEQLLGELRGFIGSEVEGSRAEVERARELIRQAVASLGSSFDAMNGKSRQQSQAVSRIVDRAGEDGSNGVDVARFAQHASQRMEQLVEALEQVSGQSNVTVAHIDQMAQHLDGIFALLEDVKSIADQTDLLALNAAIEAARAGEAGRGFCGGRRRGTQPVRALDHLQRADPQAGPQLQGCHFQGARDGDPDGLARHGPLTRSSPGSSRDARQRCRDQQRTGRWHARNRRLRPGDRWQRQRGSAFAAV